MNAETPQDKKDADKLWWLGYAVCAIGSALTIAAFYPGFMSPDSVAVWQGGREQVFHDINSPAMGYLWGLLDKLTAGPPLMFILQNLIFWVAAAIFWRATKDKSLWLATALVLFGFLPQIWSQLTTVWKDVHLGASLLMAVALIYYASRCKRKLPLLLSPIFLFYGYAARLNALPAVLPLAIWSGLVFSRVFNIRSRTAPIAFGVIYFVILSAAVFLAIYGITAGRTVHPFQQVYLYDLAGVSKARNEPLFPDYILTQKDFSLENVKTEYNLRSVNSLIYGDLPNKGDKPILPLSNNPAEIKELRAKWLEVIVAHPALYLQHRGRIFAQLIGLTTNTVSNPYWDVGFAANPSEFRGEPNLLTNILMRYFHAFRKILFRGFVWTLPCLLFVYPAVKRRLQSDWETVFFLSMSCLLFTAAYFPTTPSTEFRYLFWSAIASALSIIFAAHLLWGERWARKVEQ